MDIPNDRDLLHIGNEFIYRKIGVNKAIHSIMELGYTLDQACDFIDHWFDER